ncbi:metallophosphoesterase [Paenibacillus sp. J5C_2022]|uniref:metallophosphoesterase n=1 Tax=Paenibacillus sp. J5C2022 TaxID=2977129 RepID=UPI0021D231FF|nr:metallophosphoesterase [Paenibacillus sp. J5C2022]MCU6710278.1 metallophosphoesterase [Paenibacillus sp. J5C2022]
MLFFIGALLLAAAIYLLLILPTRWVKVEHVRMDTGLGLRILQISDLHVDMLRVSPSALQRIIHDAKPDYILLTGDYTYRDEYFARLGLYVRMIASCGIPAYAVLGNHDYEFPRVKRIVGLFRANGIPVLRNESVQLPRFQLVGIDNCSTGHSRPTRAFRDVNRMNGKPVIVMTHDPNVVLTMREPFHYMMAGHFHGKQLNIPFFFKLKPKGPLPDRGIYKGVHRHELGKFYISKGIGQAGVNARFLVRSEVSIHDL